MDIQALLDEVAGLEVEVSRAPPGDPRMTATLARVDELERRLDELRGLQAPLVPDAERAPGEQERSAANLDRALRSIRAAAQAKQRNA
jgi:hypothetical protein